MSQRRTLSVMFSCKTAFTMRFFQQHTHGIVLGTAPDSQDFVFQTHDLRLSRLSAQITLLRGLVFDERGSLNTRPDFLQSRLEAPEAHGVARAAQCVWLVEAPATGCSFFRPRNVFFQTARLVFFQPPSFFQPRDKVEKKDQNLFFDFT